MKITKNPFVTLKEYEGDIFLIADDNVFHLDGIGAFVWEKIEDDISEDQVVDLILTEYEVTEKKAKKDINSLLKNLNKYNIISIHWKWF